MFFYGIFSIEKNKLVEKTKMTEINFVGLLACMCVVCCSVVVFKIYDTTGLKVIFVVVCFVLLFVSCCCLLCVVFYFLLLFALCCCLLSMEVQ